MKRRKYTYVVIHFPRQLLKEALGKNPEAKEIIFSSKFREDEVKVIATEISPMEPYARSSEETVTLDLPISETNRHQELSSKGMVSIHLYFLKENKGE